MKNILKIINLIAVFSTIILLIGILSSYLNFGIFAVIFSVLLPVLFLLNICFSVIGFWNKKYYYATGFILFLICFNFFFRLPIGAVTSQSFNTISILSYNVRGFNSGDDINDSKISSKILNFINNKNADILVLQESSYIESRGIKDYPYKFLGYREDKEKELLAIYSKYLILNTGYIDFPNTLNNAIYVDIKINSDTTRIYNIHLQSFSVELNSGKDKNNRYTSVFERINNGLSKQIQQAKLVKREINNCDKKVIICGDFNSTQFSLPYRILKKELKDSFISKGVGLGTTYSLFHYPLRLDFILLDQSLEIIKHENFDLNLSDHEPILMKFNI